MIILFKPHLSAAIGNWVEIAYGTEKGKVRIITEHPETLGQSPQLFQVRINARRRMKVK